MAKRANFTYNNLSSSFLLQATDYHKQFYHLYIHRLAEMTRLLTPLVLKKWGKEVPIMKVCEIRGEQIHCIIIGTIYKHQAHKPSILRDISEENQLAPQPQRQNYSEPEDKVMLEDELQRVRLQGDTFETSNLATGIVCAVKGTTDNDGFFNVEEILFFESGPQKPLANRENGNKLVLLSGLDYMQSHNYNDALNMFQYWLSGCFGSKSEAQATVRLIIAGNSVRSTAMAHVPTLHVARQQANAKDTVQAVSQLDSWFSAWAKALHVDVMPGPYDPSNFMLPQQPFHKCMFPLCARMSSFQSVSNPYACRLDSALIVGTAGQNIADLLRTTSLESSLQALRCTLIWGHVAPTAPDTLSCYPYLNSDPFIIKECPHVYFAGNCESFATDLHCGPDGKQTRLVCVPSFSKTQSVALVDLETLQCRQIKFGVESE